MLMRLFIVMVLVSASIHVLAQEQARPLSSKSAVLIVEPLAGSPAQTNDAALERLVRVHTVSLASEQNLRKAVVSGKHDLRKTKWFNESRDVTERTAWLRKNLRVQRVEGTPLIELGLDGITDASERSKVLESICETYLETLRSDRTAQYLDRTQMLNNLKIKTEMRMKDITADMREKQIKLNLDGGGGMGGRIGFKEMELSALVSRFIEAQFEAGRLRSEFENLEATIKEGKAPANYDVDAEPRLRELINRLDEVEIQLAITRATVDKASPEFAQVEARAEAVRKVLQSRRDEMIAQAKVRMMEETRNKAQAATDRAETMAKRIDNLKNDLGELSASMVTFYNLQEEQKGLREQLKSVRSQIEEAMAQASSQAVDVRWHLHPEAVDLP